MRGDGSHQQWVDIAARVQGQQVLVQVSSSGWLGGCIHDRIKRVGYVHHIHGREDRLDRADQRIDQAAIVRGAPDIDHHDTIIL